jgi:hypothetical protein
MADKKFPPARADNFRLMDPQAPRTRRLIEAVLSADMPWAPERDHVAYDKPKVAEIAERIHSRANQGLTVHLKPETAKTAALALHLYAQGPGDLQDNYPHQVIDLTHEPRQVLAYTASATLAIGAWEHYAPEHPDRKLIATWGGWITRGSKREIR